MSNLMARQGALPSRHPRRRLSSFVARMLPNVCSFWNLSYVLCGGLVVVTLHRLHTYRGTLISPLKGCGAPFGLTPQCNKVLARDMWVVEAMLLRNNSGRALGHASACTASWMARPRTAAGRSWGFARHTVHNHAHQCRKTLPPALLIQTIGCGLVRLRGYKALEHAITENISVINVVFQD